MLILRLSGLPWPWWTTRAARAWFGWTGAAGWWRPPSPPLRPGRRWATATGRPSWRRRGRRGGRDSGTRTGSSAAVCRARKSGPPRYGPYGQFSRIKISSNRFKCRFVNQNIIKPKENTTAVDEFSNCREFDVLVLLSVVIPKLKF